MEWTFTPAGEPNKMLKTTDGTQIPLTSGNDDNHVPIQWISMTKGQ
jgi:hypothetical protein